MEMLSQEIIDQRMQDVIRAVHVLTLPFQSVSKPFPCHDGDDTEYTTTLGGLGISVFPGVNRSTNGYCHIADIGLEMYYGVRNVGSDEGHLVLDVPDDIWEATLYQVIQDLKTMMYRRMDKLVHYYTSKNIGEEYKQSLKVVWNQEENNV